MLLTRTNGATSVILRVKLLDSSVTTGAGLTGLTSASSGLIISTIADVEATATTYTVGGSTIESITTLGTYAAPTATKCRFKEVDSTNHKGVYEIQLADARFAVSGARSLLVSVLGATNLAQCDFVVQLDNLNEIADAVLKRDMSAVSGESSRSLLNALRFLRNKWTISAGTLTVYKEDDSTSAWTGSVTGTAGADPITTVDPA